MPATPRQSGGRSSVDEAGERLLASVVDRAAALHPTRGRAAAILAVREGAPGAAEDLERLIHTYDRRTADRIQNTRGAPGVPAIESVADAIRTLGFRRVHSAALATSAIAALREPTHALDRERFWRYSVAVAQLATVAAAIECTTPQGDAFAGGLFHAVGRLVLDQLEPERSARVAALVASGAARRAAAQTAAFGFTEEALAPALARRWASRSGSPGRSARCPRAAADLRAAQRSLWALVRRARLAALTRGFAFELEPPAPSPRDARWSVEPLLVALDREGGDAWLEARVTTLLRTALMDHA